MNAGQGTRPHRRDLMLAAGVLSFVVIFALRWWVANPAEAIGILYVIPVAFLAIECGPWLGAGAGALAVVLSAVWALTKDVPVGALGYSTRGAVFVLVGALVGHLTEQRKRLEERNTRLFEMSTDLLCEANHGGYLIRVNDAWTARLGYSRAELLAQPYVNFVHPDERERSRGNAARFAAEPSELRTNGPQRSARPEGLQRCLVALRRYFASITAASCSLPGMRWP